MGARQAPESVGADPNVQQAREIGKLTGAQLVLIGRAIAKPLGETMAGSGWFFYAALIRPLLGKKEENKEGAEKVTLAPWLGPQGAGVGATWRF